MQYPFLIKFYDNALIWLHTMTALKFFAIFVAQCTWFGWLETYGILHEFSCFTELNKQGGKKNKVSEWLAEHFIAFLQQA